MSEPDLSQSDLSGPDLRNTTLQKRGFVTLIDAIRVDARTSTASKVNVVPVNKAQIIIILNITFELYWPTLEEGNSFACR